MDAGDFSLDLGFGHIVLKLLIQVANHGILNKVEASKHSPSLVSLGYNNLNK